MTSYTYAPSIDQGAKLSFQDSFYALAQQKVSKLQATGAIKFLPSEGKTTNFARMGRIELDQVEGRNPLKSYGDYSLDNRQFTKFRFSKTILIDAKHDINELLKDPTSDILKQLVAAKERVVDRIAVSVAGGAVLVGAPDASPSSISAATDGVITVDASAGLTYEKIQEITQNFINNELDYSEFMGSTLCLTGKENSALMNELEFISSDYISGKPVEKGMQESAGTYKIQLFGGSSSAGTVINPILTEGTTTRSCIVMAPESVVMAMEIARLDVERSSKHVNSNELTIDFWIGGLRTEGAKVQLVTTTM